MTFKIGDRVVIKHQALEGEVDRLFENMIGVRLDRHISWYFASGLSLVELTIEPPAELDTLTAAHAAEVERLKAALYELTKDIVTKYGDGDVCAYCEAVNYDEREGSAYGELDDPDNHKKDCPWRIGAELSMDVHRRKNAERYGTKGIAE